MIGLVFQKLKRHATALTFIAAYLAWLLRSARTLGFSRDESFYFDAARSYAGWFAALLERPKLAITQPVVDAAWSPNHEHPALVKSLFGLSWLYVHEKWKLLLDESTAFRLPGMLFMCLALWITYRFGRRAYGNLAGLFAMVALAMMPRVFYHAHLACFDIPITAMWVLCIYAYHRAVVRGGIGRIFLAAFVFGLTLETKHNAWMLPGVFLVHAVGHAWLLRFQWRDGAFRPFAILAAMGVVGPATFVGLWPWIWRDTVERVKWYVNFHLNHEYYNMEFFGKNYDSAPSPWSYAPVMIVATVPTVTLLFFLYGAGHRIWRTRARIAGRPASRATVSTDLLIFLGLCVPLSVFFLPKTPIFGGTKHWLTAYPFLCLLAGRGFVLCTLPLLHVRDRWSFKRMRYGLLTLTLLPALLITSHSHPFGLSSYVPLVGGTAGGATIGLNRQFWGFTTQSLAPYLEREARPGTRLYVHDTTHGAFVQMQREKRIPQGISPVFNPSEGDMGILHHELHMVATESNLETVFGPSPSHVLTHDGVPIVSVYKR